jgi:CRP/FNR family cyclic AMP-dependent transcriptional regulator
VPDGHASSQTTPPQTVAAQSQARVLLLSVDLELAEAVPAQERLRAQRVMWTPTLTFDAGPVDLTMAPLSSTAFVLLVIKGMLTRQTGLGDRAMIELLLAGDGLAPWPPSPGAPLTETRLTALDEVRLAVLDHTFVKAAALWPGLLIAVQRRFTEQQHRLATHGAICQLPRVEQRVMAIMWLLAARTGTVTARGTELSLALTHDALAQLTGSRRPTVSLAVKRLRQRGYLARGDDGVWLLPRVPTTVGFEDLIANLSEV